MRPPPPPNLAQPPPLKLVTPNPAVKLPSPITAAKAAQVVKDVARDVVNKAKVSETIAGDIMSNPIITTYVYYNFPYVSVWGGCFVVFYLP